MRCHQSQSGFLLIQLSVVIVIIALLVGGVTVGRNVMHVSELKSVAADANRYIGMAGNFKTQYGYLPGDFPKATSIWGTVNATLATCQTTQGTGTQTCDGNGDGRIGDYWLYGTAYYYHEMFRAWQQLANAGMLEGTYTGIGGSGAAHEVVPGQNVPRSKLELAGFNWMDVRGREDGSGAFFPGEYKTALLFGAEKSGDLNGNPVLTATDAASIDAKMDDGNPAYGNVMSLRNGFYSNNCSTSNTPASAAYNVATSGLICSLVFKMAF